MTRLQLITDVNNPSFLAFHPNGRYLYAVEEISNYQGQNRGSLVAFGIDQQSGRLTATGAVTTAATPVCLLFKQL